MSVHAYLCKLPTFQVQCNGQGTKQLNCGGKFKPGLVVTMLGETVVHSMHRVLCVEINSMNRVLCLCLQISKAVTCTTYRVWFSRCIPLVLYMNYICLLSHCVGRSKAFSRVCTTECVSRVYWWVRLPTYCLLFSSMTCTHSGNTIRI